MDKRYNIIGIALATVIIPLWIIAIPYLLIMRLIFGVHADLNLFGRHTRI